jgi:hypothetical protein
VPPNEFRGDSELSFNPRRQTGGLWEVVSFDAVFYPNLHLFSHVLAPLVIGLFVQGTPETWVPRTLQSPHTPPNTL